MILDEAERIEWLSWPDVAAAAAAGQIGDGLSLTALLLRLHQRATAGDGTAGNDVA